MHLLIGLGNPGKEYDTTRHNIGFQVINLLADRYRLSGPKSKANGHLWEGNISGERVLALKPLTYMNRSGTCVSEIARFYKISPASIIVFHDDLDLLLGKVRVKRGGGDGGHNGLKSLDAHIGKDYMRVRIGIDRPSHPGMDTADYVLGKFSVAEGQEVESLLQPIADHVTLLLRDEMASFMNILVQEQQRK